MTTNLLNLFLLIGASSGFIFVIANKLKIRLLVSLLTFCLMIIPTYYLLAVFGLLQFSNVIFYLAGFYSLFTQRRRFPKMRLSNIKFLSAWLLPAFLAASALVQNFYFTYADELVSWGFNSKSIFLSKSLLDSDSIGGFENSFLHYPPGVPLFHFFTASQLGWTEPTVVVSQLLLICIALSCASYIISKKNAAILFISSISIYYLLGFTLLSILPDGLLGALFLCTISIIIYGDQNEIKYLVPLLMLCLVLVKPAGLVLAITCLAIQVLNKRTHGNRTKLRMILNLISIFGAWITWNIYLRFNYISDGIPKIKMDYLQGDYFKNRMSISIKTHAQNLISPLYGPDNPSGISLSNPAILRISQISLFTIVVLLFVFHLFFACFNSSSKYTWTIPVSLLSGFFLYQAFLQFVFLFYNSEYEGNNSAGLVRYTATYLFAWVCICLYEILNASQDSRFLFIGVFFCICFSLVTSNFPREILTGQNNSSRALERTNLEKLVTEINNEIGDKNLSTYVIYQDSWGFESLAFRLSNLPNKTNRNCWSFNFTDYEGDKWACDADLLKLITDYDYLLVLNGLEDISGKFPELFNEGEYSNSVQLFEITGQSNNLKLYRVDLSMG